MLRFEYIEHLYALLLLPVLAVLFALAWRARKKAIQRFGEEGLMAQLMPQLSSYKHYIKFSLLMLITGLLVVAWANPQYGTKLRKYKKKSVDVFIAFDVSQSMMAEDVSPSRIDRARRFTQNLVQGLRTERLGLIFFAGSAYLQSPITTDYNAILLALRSADPATVLNQGTAIAEAIELAEESFDENNKSHRALIIITDGENHNDEAVSRAAAARENGIITYTIGVGTTQGSYIPVNDPRGQSAYKRDRNGEPVVSRLNPEVLNEIASSGDGKYFNLSAGSDKVLDVLKDRINQMEKTELEQRTFSEYESSFQWFVAAAIIFLLVEFLLPYRRGKQNREGKLFDI
jgi:Ca-activated chloride channel family protein